VSRLVLALEAEGFLAATGPRGRYRLGPEFIRMAAAARRSAWQELHPLIADLSQEIGETVDLSVLERDRAVFVDQVVADNRLQAVSAVGDSFPLHASANGKALLASMPEPDVRRVLAASLERFTPSTITDPAVLEKELTSVRTAGIAYDREEHSEGVSALGVVIGTVDHDLLAVSVPMPTHRFTQRENEICSALEAFNERVDAWVRSH
jgi:DNA-binding IclR family transcriptional regulator